MDTAQIIWNYLKKQGFSDYGIAGIMGNLYAESALQPDNLQNSANTNLKMTDKQYTDVVDNGTYTNFFNDGAGYGIAQWTYPTLKEELYNICKKNNTSISDINSQLECLIKQLTKQKLLDTLKNAKSVQEASDYFLTKFERPKDQSEAVKQKRLNFSNLYLKQFSLKGEKKMKYTEKNPPLVCMATQCQCYKSNKKMTIRGVLWHSTGANNPTLKRYVQPSEDDPNKEKLLSIIGVNPNRNHHNKVTNNTAGLNAWIGKLADGSITTIQTMPWNYAPWGCGAGWRGSCNDGWIQFEICEDDLLDKNYFEAVYKEAVEFTAYLCKTYNLNPKGTVKYKNADVPVILCHRDSSTLGLGSAHGDVLHWFKRYNKTMDDVRNDVAKLIAESKEEEGKKEEEVPEIKPEPQPVPEEKIIKYGDIGEEVKQLQERLIQLDYYCGVDGPDGEFGPNTYTAVRKFQEDHNLEIDGIVGKETLNAINKEIERQKQKESSNVPYEIYRVRLDWNKPETQIGAFKVLDNAKRLVDNSQNGYKVFNSLGNVVYPTEQNKQEEKPSETVKPAKTYSNVMLGSASHDERGQYRGGQAGDQTGTEVAIQNWYLGNWDTVLRPRTVALAEKIAVADESACGNNAIGYDQYQRNTLLAEAKKVGMDLSKITTPCECDCSSLVSTCCVCAGLPESIFFPGGNGCTTWVLENACRKTGQFEILKASKYTKQKDYLKRGDILLQTDMHVVIVLQDGAKANSESPVVPSSSETIDGKFPYIVKVNTDILNVRAKPDINGRIVTRIYRNYKYTIVEESEGWGRLKSGAGWIDLSYTVKV